MEASRWRYVVWIGAAVYALGVAAVALRHEPWADEAQAWLIARDSNPIELAVDVLRYEGHPILWYLVLTPFAKTLPYGAMTVVAVLFGIAGALLWTLRSPVPLAVRLAVPFTYFLFYQYAVVARSYVLLPLLMFWLAHEYPRRHERPWRFVLICALLTFTSVFPAIGAGCIMLAFFVVALMRRADLSAEEKRRYWLCFGAYVAAGLFLVYQLWQPENSTFYRWHINWNDLLNAWKGPFNTAKYALNASMTERWILTLPIVAVSLVWFYFRRTLFIYLAPTLCIMTLFGIKYFNGWHEGVLVLWWLFAVWVSFDKSIEPRKWEPKFMRWAMAAACLAFCAVQIFWTVQVSRNDWSGEYSPGKQLSAAVKERGLENGNVIGLNFWSTTFQPYFQNNLFSNHNGGNPPAFWRWEKPDDPNRQGWGDSVARDADINKLLEGKPDAIIVSHPGGDFEGYERLDFEGNMYWKNRIKENNRAALYIREDWEP